MELPKVWKDLQTSDGEQAPAIGDVDSSKKHKARERLRPEPMLHRVCKWQTEKYYGRADDLQSRTRRRTDEQAIL